MIQLDTLSNVQLQFLCKKLKISISSEQPNEIEYIQNELKNRLLGGHSTKSNKTKTKSNKTNYIQTKPIKSKKHLPTSNKLKSKRH